MHPAGLAEVERAKADGRWDAAYAGSATIEVPADLIADGFVARDGDRVAATAKGRPVLDGVLKALLT